MNLRGIIPSPSRSRNLRSRMLRNGRRGAVTPERLERRSLWVGLLVGVYLLSGLYIVRGNEQGIVRRFGRMQPGSVGPGLHYSLPWPCSKVTESTGTKSGR